MRHLTPGTLERSRVAIQTSLFVAGIVILKLIVNSLSGATHPTLQPSAQEFACGVQNAVFAEERALPLGVGHKGCDAGEVAR